MKFFILALLLAGLFNLVCSSCQKTNSRALKTYEINLDDKPLIRFSKISTDFRRELTLLIKIQKESFSPYLVALLPIIEKIAAKIDSFIPYPYNEEMKGIANATGIDIGDIVILNLFYDATAWCTSIVTQTKSGKIIHGRNLDYDFAKYLNNATYIARYTKNGKLLYTSINAAGFLGVLTGHKYNKFTFSINERDEGNWWKNYLIAILDRRAKPLALITRDILEYADDFNSAVKMFSNTEMIAPAYFILGGIKPNEGVVITRDQYSTIDIWQLNSSSITFESWYLLETNYDHWVSPPSNDDRRTPGMKAMNLTGQENINYDTLLDVLTIDPVCNKDTIYSLVMSAVDEDVDMEILMRYN